MRIFSLYTKDFFTGIASAAHIEFGGLWHKAEGINAFVDPNYQSTQVGLLQTCSSPTAISNFSGTPLAGISRVTGANSGTYYFTTSAGLYELDLTSLSTANLIWGNSNIKNGLELFQSRNSTEEYLYFWQNNKIGRYGDLNGTPVVDANWQTSGIEDTEYHPTHRMWDEIYYGNKNKIGQIKDDGAGGVTHSGNVLDFESNMLVTALEDDGQFLVIGMSTNQGDNNLYGHSLIRFWKLYDSSWSYEWKIPEPNILAIKRVGNALFAICPYGIYVFNRLTPPKKIRSIASSTPFGRSNAVSALGDVILFGAGSNATVGAYGKMTREVPNAYHEPYAGGTGNPTLIDAEAKHNIILVGTDAGKLYKYDITTGGSTATAETVFIPLRERYFINRIEVIFGEHLANGDSLAIKLQSDNDTTAKTFGEISYAKHGAKRRIAISGQKNDIDNLKMILEFSGNPKIKQINVYGDLISKNG